jgi:hypothetical protein
VPVRAQHQLALRTAPHPPDLLHRQNCQSRSPALFLFSIEFYALQPEFIAKAEKDQL